jgi:predicted GIY-YIG superfamily endonuclease
MAVVYILKSTQYNKTYIGCTVDMTHRLRQHNGEIVGGAKKTSKWRPWEIIMVVTGFTDRSQALRFEYRLQRPKRKKKVRTDSTTFVLENCFTLINRGEGVAHDSAPWPQLTLYWYQAKYEAAFRR